MRNRSLSLLCLPLALTGNTTFADVVFSEGFENGLSPAVWDWTPGNWGGTKQITTSNPHTGNFALYMNGSDSSPGGCSMMRPTQLFSLPSAEVVLNYRNISLMPGGASGGGWVDIDLYNASGTCIGMFREGGGAGDTSSWWWTDKMQWSHSQTRIRSVSGWNEFGVLYNHGAFGSRVDLLLNGQSILTATTSTDFGDFGRFVLGAGGQADNVGAWYIDDVTLISPVPEPATLSLLVLSAASLLIRHRRCQTVQQR
jgi:hypothetical protein